jgi:hypothetical protein
MTGDPNGPPPRKEKHQCYFEHAPASFSQHEAPLSRLQFQTRQPTTTPHTMSPASSAQTSSANSVYTEELSLDHSLPPIDAQDAVMLGPTIIADKTLNDIKIVN